MVQSKTEVQYPRINRDQFLSLLEYEGIIERPIPDKRDVIQLYELLIGVTSGIASMGQYISESGAQKRIKEFGEANGIGFVRIGSLEGLNEEQRKHKYTINPVNYHLDIL